MEDINKIADSVDVIDEITKGMLALAQQYNLDLWYGMTFPFPIMRFMFDNGEKDVTIEIDVKEQIEHNIKKYIEEDVAEYLVDIFGLANGVEAE